MYGFCARSAFKNACSVCFATANSEGTMSGAVPVEEIQPIAHSSCKAQA